MIGLNFTIASILILFLIFLFLRSFLKVKVCALCGAVSLTWILILVFLYVGKEVDVTSLSILMGGSIVGLMYYLERKLPEDYEIFRVPYFISAFLVTYMLVEKKIEIPLFVSLLGLWVLFIIFLFLYRADKFKSSLRKIIECCKNW